MDRSSPVARRMTSAAFSAGKSSNTTTMLRVEDGERRRRDGGGPAHLLGPRGDRPLLLVGADVRAGHQAQGRGGRGARRWREGAVASVRVGRRTVNGRGQREPCCVCGRGRADER
ncbi:DUF1336 domain containing protein expressed [Zea mays]|uniref:DUF1336 domain containing protein expressed n=1 Tax=Zea mays TaxID=4577 RepID=A0A1D6LTR2_MAIZE|nr:DUF1336 domain containing protein expressed [Zea mays]AQK82790.1 DUF1336 domain containing protein expressed [Zea mays]